MAGSMKKAILSFVLVGFLAVALGLTACAGGSAGEENPLVGTWVLSGMEIDGEEVPQESLDEYLDLMGGETLKVVFEAGDKVNLTLGGEESQDATYTFADGKGTLRNAEFNETLDFTLEEGELKIESEGSYLIFAKQ